MIDPQRLKKLMKQLSIPNGFRAGLPMQLTKWESDIIDDIFSSPKRPEIVYIEIPRKNGKTTFIASLITALFNLDDEPGAEFYCASGDKEQAGIIYSIADYMIRSSPALSKRIRTIPSQKKFVMKKEPTTFFRSLSSDAHSKHGYNPYISIFDELHIFKSRELWDVLDTGDIARENPMKIIITTAGNDMASLCGEFHELAKSVIAGRIVDNLFRGYIFTVADKDEWGNEEQWRIANPSLQEGILKIERIRQKYLRAKGKPVAEAAFKRLHLNIWQELIYKWFNIKNIQNLSVMPKGGVGGLDLGFGADTTSFAHIKKDGDKLFLKTYIWITENEARRQEKMHGIPYYDWIKKGYVRTYGNEIADYEILERDLFEICKQNGIKKVGYDRWKSHHLVGRLNRRLEMIPIGQGFKSMTMPVRIFEAYVGGGKIFVDYNPALITAFKQTYIKEDAAGNAKPDKQKAWHKIDPAVASLTALALLEIKSETKKSIYEKRGV